MNFSYQRILLAGAGGKTGRSYSRLLLRDGKHLFAYDANPEVRYEDELTASERFTVVSSEKFNDFSILDQVDAVTLSPGVPLGLPLFTEAQKRNIPVFSELEYCFEQLKDKTWVCITGTDGKSTTAALIEKLAQALLGREHAVACGNYGIAFSELLFREKCPEVLVAELSSYQLELSRNLSPDVAIYLNLSPDHLNRYKNLEAYGLVKWNIFQKIKPNGLSLINRLLLPENSGMWQEKLSLPPGYVSVDTENLRGGGFSWKDGVLFYHQDQSKTERPVAEAAALKIRGKHNESNILFAVNAAEWLAAKVKPSDPGLNKEDWISCLGRALTEFSSLAHRFEKIELPGPNVYINDSKATTTQAAKIAIENAAAVKPAPLAVFLGGQSKGEDYCVLRPVLEKAAQKEGATVYLFGQNREEIKQALFEANPGLQQTNESRGRSGFQFGGCFETLSSAFGAARQDQAEKKTPSVIYLLSPASTSWDQYASFEVRGEDFRNLVLAAAKH